MRQYLFSVDIRSQLERNFYCSISRNKFTRRYRDNLAQEFPTPVGMSESLRGWARIPGWEVNDGRR